MLNRIMAHVWTAPVVLLSVISVTLVYAQPGQSDTCLGTKYKNIDDYRRSVNYVTTGTAICDSTLETGWYRFTSPAGGMMPTTCVGTPYRCGTVAPISYDGPMPAEGQTVAGQAIEYYTECRPLRTISISVKNCTSYLIYYLSPTPGCSTAYCAGDRTMCKDGETSNDGFSPCSRVLNITVTSQLKEDKAFNANYNRYMMQFHCDVTLQGPDLDASTMVEVSFLANDVIVQTTVLPPGLRKGILEEQGPWNMGDTITCKARAVENTTYSEWSPVSNTVTTGIQVQETFIEVYMPNGDNTMRSEIKFDLISPIYCNHGISSCGIRVFFSNPSDAVSLRPECFNPISFSPVLLFEKDCYVDVSNITQHQTHSIGLTVMVDDYISSGTDFAYRDYITMGMVGRQVENAKWSFYKLAPVKVRVHRTQPNPNVVCQQTYDPHFTTYPKRYFDYHGLGEYVLFNHTKYAIQINLLYEQVRSGISSTCGAAVRVDRRVITFNHCAGRTALEIKYYANGCSNETTGLRLILNGTKYEVHIATGAKFVIQPSSTGSKWYNSWYYPSRLDHLNNTGACGIVGAEFNKDLIKRDGTVTPCPQGPTSAAGYDQNCINGVWNSWKATSPADMLMDGQPGNNNCTSGFVRTCMCYTPPAEADNITTEAVCFAVPPGDVCSLAVDKLHLYEVPTQSYSTDNVKSMVATPTLHKKRKTYNTSEAYDLCYQGIYASASAEVTKQLLPVEDILATVNFCAFDVVAIGDETPIAVHNQALTVAATETMYRNASMWSNSSETGEMVPPADIATQLCPNSCSGHGTCSDMAVCVCDVNYAGADCSIDLTQVPAELQLLSSDVCDLLTGACDSVDIYGEWFAEGSLCKYRSVSVDGTTVEDDSIYTVPNYYLSISSVRCPLPKYALNAYGFNISVSNAGSVFSNEVFLLVYNSDCRNCDVTMTPPCSTLDFCEVKKRKMKLA